MTSIDQFKEEFIHCLQDKLGADKYEVIVREVIKSNDIKLTGISVKDLNQESNISPTMYIESIYDDYNGSNVEELADEIIHMLDNVTLDSDIDLFKLTDSDFIKHNSFLRVINAEKNYKYLLDKPYQAVEGFDDLVAIAVIEVDLKKPGEKGSVAITDQLLDATGLDKDKLFGCAKMNSQYSQPVSIMNINDVLKMLTDENSEDYLNNDVSFYVLSNISNVNGASVITYDGIMEQIHEKIGENFTIIPSSIHEVLILGDSTGTSSDYIREMVSIVNSTCVAPKDFLSNNIYHYDGAEKTVTMISQPETDLSVEK